MHLIFIIELFRVPNHNSILEHAELIFLEEFYSI